MEFLVYIYRHRERGGVGGGVGGVGGGGAEVYHIQGDMGVHRHTGSPQFHIH